VIKHFVSGVGLCPGTQDQVNVAASCDSSSCCCSCCSSTGSCCCCCCSCSCCCHRCCSWVTGHSVCPVLDSVLEPRIQSTLPPAAVTIPLLSFHFTIQPMSMFAWISVSPVGFSFVSKKTESVYSSSFASWQDLSQSYRASPAIWMGSHSVSCHLTQVNTPNLNPDRLILNLPAPEG